MATLSFLSGSAMTVSKLEGSGGFAVLNHTIHMKEKSLFSHTAGIIKVSSRSHDPAKIGKGNTEVAIRVLMDQSDILARGSPQV
jgi:hypothetical protein